MKQYYFFKHLYFTGWLWKKNWNEIKKNMNLYHMIFCECPRVKVIRCISKIQFCNVNAIITLNLPISKDQHNPSIQLSQGFGYKILSSLGENGANEPQIEWICGQREDVWIWSRSLLKGLTWTTRFAWTLLFQCGQGRGRHQLVVGVFGLDAGVDVTGGKQRGILIFEIWV